MQITPTNITVADYCDAMERKDIIVNNDYQRSDKVWPAMARSYLIETILTGFPVPKLSLYQRTDLASRKTFKEIVDGQQRSVAIKDFFDGKLRLSKKLETDDVAGRVYSELDPEYQQRFVGYSLTVDLFGAASPEEVVEVFRRMNSYTVPLNAEEQRHAGFQGAFKWFINRMAERFKATFLQTGLFGQKQLVRMADNKLLTEITHALINGITTTDKKSLDDLYDDNDMNFSAEKDIETRLTYVFDELRDWEQIHATELMKHYHVYALALALTHISRPVTKLQKLYRVKKGKRIDKGTALANLSVLSEALKAEDPPSRFKKFVKASEEKTNVAHERSVRFKCFCAALAKETI